MTHLVRRTLADVFGDRLVDETGHAFVLDNEPSLVGGEFHDREFVDIDFTKAQVIGVKFKQCVFTRCDFRELHLDSVEFRECRFDECDFSGALLVGVTFDFSDLVSCSMRKIHGDEVSFVEARLLRTELTPGNLVFTREDDDQDYWEGFVESKMETALDLSDAELRRVDFSRAIASGIRLDGALLVECDMKAALLVESSFAKSMLIDCDFRFAHLIPPSTFDSWVNYGTGGGEWVTTLSWSDTRRTGKDTDFDSCGINFEGMTQNGGESGEGTLWPRDFEPGPPTASRNGYFPNWLD